MSLTQEQHREEAIRLFNRTWDLMELKERTSEQDMEMIHTAHASRYHWGEVGDYVNWSRGDWQISRVYAVLGEGKNALRYALSNERIHNEYILEDFDAAFVHEALARSYAILDDPERTGFHLGKARGLASGIAKESDLKYFLSELETI